MLGELAAAGETKARDFLADYTHRQAAAALARGAAESTVRAKARAENDKARAAREKVALAASARGHYMPHGAAKAERARRRALLGHVMPKAGKRRNVAR